MDLRGKAWAWKNKLTMSKSKSEICISVSQQRLQVELGDGARSQGVENQCKHGLFTAKRRVSGTKETVVSLPLCS